MAPGLYHLCILQRKILGYTEVWEVSVQISHAYSYCRFVHICCWWCVSRFRTFFSLSSIVQRRRDESVVCYSSHNARQVGLNVQIRSRDMLIFLIVKWWLCWCLTWISRSTMLYRSIWTHFLHRVDNYQCRNLPIRCIFSAWKWFDPNASVTSWVR